jgi:phage/plasmid-like protein (TIGR03299 family)
MSDVLNSLVENTQPSVQQSIAPVAAGPVPWAGVSKAIEPGLSGRDVLCEAGLQNWGLEKVRQTVRYGGVDVLTDKYAIMRSDTHEFISSVGSDYEIVTNEEIVDFISKLVGHDAKYERAGCLAGGKKIWFLVEVPELACHISGSDEMKSYVMFANSHGLGRMVCNPTSLRMTCNNMYNAATKAGGWRFSHTRSIHRQMSDAVQEYQNAKQALRNFNDTAQFLANVRINTPDLYFSRCLDQCLNMTIADETLRGNTAREHKNVLDAIMTITDDQAKNRAYAQYEYAAKRRGNLLDEILERHASERCEGNPDIAGTLWSAANAVSEMAQHTSRIHYKGEGRVKDEARMKSAMSGKAAEWTQIAIDTGVSLATAT